MTRSLALDPESDVVRGVAMGLAFLVGLALNLDPERRVLALAVFGGGAVAFFGLAALAAIDDEYASPQLRWYLFAAWGVLLFAVGVWTESAVSGIGGVVIAVYAAIRAWLFDAVDESEEGEGAEPWDETEAADEEHPAARSAVPPDRARREGNKEPDDEARDNDGQEAISEHEDKG